MKHPKSRNRKGYTLIDILIALAVVVIGVLATAFSMANVHELMTLAREKEIAMNDANRVLEAMRQTADNSLTTLQSTNWNSWLTTNVVNLKAQDELLLDQETANVTVGNGNPMAVTLILSWNHKQRPYSYRVMTLMTDRG